MVFRLRVRVLSPVFDQQAATDAVRLPCHLPAVFADSTLEIVAPVVKAKNILAEFCQRLAVEQDAGEMVVQRYAQTCGIAVTVVINTPPVLEGANCYYAACAHF